MNKKEEIKIWYTIEKRYLEPYEFKIMDDGSIETFGVYAHKSQLIKHAPQ